MANSPKTPHLFVVEDRGYETPCHVWTRAVGSHGYGSIKIRGKVVLAHRHYYEAARGPIPNGKIIDHLCRVPLCVNPDHLDVVTVAENTRRGSAAKLDRAQVEEIRARRRAGETTIALGAEFGVAPVTITHIGVGNTWAA